MGGRQEYMQRATLAKLTAHETMQVSPHSALLPCRDTFKWRAQSHVETAAFSQSVALA